MDWFTWSNFAYLLVLIAGALLTVVSTKWRNVVKEAKEALEKYKEAMADGTMTKKEKEAVMKETLDILGAILKVYWKF